MIHFIYIYFIINAFVLGWELDDTMRACKDDKGAKIFIITSIVLFGALGYAITFFYRFLLFIDGYVEARVWYQIYFGNKYTNLSNDALHSINMRKKKDFNTNSLKHRYNRYIISIILKRNKYVDTITSADS